MTSRSFWETLLKCYEQILNFIIRKFKSCFPLGKGLEKIIDGKDEFVDGKASQASRNVVKNFIVMGALHTALHILCT